MGKRAGCFQVRPPRGRQPGQAPRDPARWGAGRQAGGTPSRKEVFGACPAAVQVEPARPADCQSQPSVEAHIYTDTQAPGRLFQALKTFLGDPLEMATNVFGDAKGLEDLIALVLAHVRRRAKELTGVSPEAVTLGRPVRFIGDAAAEERATKRLRAAADLAGFRDVRLVAEPIAAAHAADLAPGTSLVFDFGGGTLDLCVVRREARGLAVLGTAGGPIGGDRATEALIDDTVA